MDERLIIRDLNEDAPVVVLERVSSAEPDELPYCVHGYTYCIRCRQQVYLGDQTVGLVASGGANPLCQQCATEIIPDQRSRIGHVQDRKHP